MFYFIFFNTKQKLYSIFSNASEDKLTNVIRAFYYNQGIRGMKGITTIFYLAIFCPLNVGHFQPKNYTNYYKF